MRVLLSFLVLLFLPIVAIGQTSLKLDQIETVTLGEDGTTLLRIKTPRAGVLRMDVFSLPANGAELALEMPITVAGETATRVGLAVIEKGTHDFILRSSVPEAFEVQIRFLLEPALDLFEPNDALEQAARISAPFLGLVRVSDGDPDWFVIDAPRDHVIGVHLRTRSAYTGPLIGFYNSSGELLYESPYDNWGHRGMRYFISDGSKTYIKISDSYGWYDYDTRAFRVLEIDVYRPDSENNNIFVKIDVAGNENVSTQLDYVSAAAGTRVSSAEDSTLIAQELERAVNSKDAPRVNFFLWMFGSLVVTLGLGGAVSYIKRRKNW